AAEHEGAAVEETWRDGSPYRLRLVTHDPRAYERFYTITANPLLWFLQHYMWGFAQAPDFDAEQHAAWQDGYAAVNVGFADAVVPELERESGASVFLHDSHLSLVPALVRARRPDVVSSQFIHIPWPATDYWTVLPAELRIAVHEGLLANDIVGLHTSRWRRAF